MADNQNILILVGAALLLMFAMGGGGGDSEKTEIFVMPGDDPDPMRVERGGETVIIYGNREPHVPPVEPDHDKGQEKDKSGKFTFVQAQLERAQGIQAQYQAIGQEYDAVLLWIRQFLQNLDNWTRGSGILTQGATNELVEIGHKILQLQMQINSFVQSYHEVFTNQTALHELQAKVTQLGEMWKRIQKVMHTSCLTTFVKFAVTIVGAQ